MVGLGETDDEVLAALRDLRSVGVDIVTIGQYLRPDDRPPAGRPLVDAGRVRHAAGPRPGDGLRPRPVESADPFELSRARSRHCVNLGIEGKVALVTAGSKGLGKASAAALAGEGCKVVICARGEEELQRHRGRDRCRVAIVSDVTERRRARRVSWPRPSSSSARFDILVANAGGPPPMRALDVDDAAIAAAINANLTTSVRLVQAAVPHMRASQWGRICCITSSSIKQPIPTLTLSNLARTGLWAWAKTAAADLFADGITLNLACPGLHATDRIKSLGANVGRAEHRRPGRLRSRRSPSSVRSRPSSSAAPR